MKTLVVGISDLAVGRDETSLKTIGLGSCIGIVLYDKESKIGGLLHILLPECTKPEEPNKAKYADTGIPLLIETMTLIGANPKRLKAAIYGGADMFQAISKTSSLSIGSRNIESTKNMLNAHKIPIVSSHIGGNKGRTVTLNCCTGEVSVKILGTSTLDFSF